MHSLLVKFMLISALMQFGWSLKTLKSCRSRQCLIQIEKQSRAILKIDWKPISVFPEEGRRFQ
jgi:hypothetical protein